MTDTRVSDDTVRGNRDCLPFITLLPQSHLPPAAP